MTNFLRWRLVFLLILVAFALYFVYLVRSVLLTFILAAILAYLLNPVVNWLQRNNIKRSVAIFLIYFTVISFASIISIMGFPKLIRELNDFAEAIPIYTEQVRSFVQNLQIQYQRIDLPESVKQVLDESIVSIEAYITEMVRQVADIFINFFSQLFYLIMAPVLAFYILKDWDSIEKRFYRMMPTQVRDKAGELLGEINLVLKKFIRGHLIVATIVGIMTAVSLSLLRVEFALTLGLIAGISDLIPYFGPIIGAIPAVLIGLLDSKALAIKVMLVMVVVQQIESNIVAPKILGDSLGLHPITIIFVLLTGGHLFGVLGMLLAVPVTAITRTVVLYFYESLVD
ncbi:MAG: AI-2E family transporter [Bacillota bacterium]|nr:AI-2E family transporter [Bacillota bacterium]